MFTTTQSEKSILQLKSSNISKIPVKIIFKKGSSILAQWAPFIVLVIVQQK